MTVGIWTAEKGGASCDGCRDRCGRGTARWPSCREELTGAVCALGGHVTVESTMAFAIDHAEFRPSLDNLETSSGLRLSMWMW